jgi:hypothetical protein
MTMSDGNYLNVGRLFPIDDCEGEVSQEKSAGTDQVSGPSLWALFDVIERSVNFRSKLLSGDRTALKVPINSSFVLTCSMFEKF